MKRFLQNHKIRGIRFWIASSVWKVENFLNVFLFFQPLPSDFIQVNTKCSFRWKPSLDLSWCFEPQPTQLYFGIDKRAGFKVSVVFSLEHASWLDCNFSDRTHVQKMHLLSSVDPISVIIFLIEFTAQESPKSPLGASRRGSYFWA